MWIVVGGLTFLLSLSYFLYQRRSADWSGSADAAPVSLPADVLSQLSTGNKGGRYRLGLPCPEHFDFLIGSERTVDKFFKVVGLTHEVQLNEPSFDEVIFVGSDDLYFHRLLKRSKLARDALHAIMTRHRDGLLGRVTLHGRAGRVWLDAKVKANVTAGELGPAMTADAANLATLQKALQELPTVLIEPVARRMRWQAAALATCSAALASCALVGWFAYGMDSDKQLYLSDLLIDSVVPALLLWGLLVVVTFVLLVRTARFHLVLLEVILIGSWGCFGAVNNASLHINMAHDQNEPIVRCTELTDKYIRRSRKGGRSYYVTLAGWQFSNGRHESSLSWKVSSELYSRVKVGQAVALLEHPGRWHYPWLSHLQQSCSTTGADSSANTSSQ